MSTWRHRRCLVTGGAGFVGAHLVQRLCHEGAHVTVLDREYDSRSYLSIAGLTQQVSCHRGDVRDVENLKGILAKDDIECVFHLAAQSLVPLSNTLPLETLGTNVMGTCSVLEAVRAVARTVPVIFASSGAVYGATHDVEPLRELDAPRAFSSIYSVSKLSADSIVLTYASVYQARAACCRFMNAYGPGDLNFSRLVPGAIRRLLLGEPLEFGSREDGGNRLGYLHVKDLANAYMSIASRMAVACGHAFNFGPDDTVETRAVIRLLSRIDGRDECEPKFYGPAQNIVKRLDTAKAAEVLGWRPTVSLEAGLRETLEWYRTHKAMVLRA